MLELDYKSMEMIADELAVKINHLYPNRAMVITVSEDNENGCTKSYSPIQGNMDNFRCN